MPVRYWRAKPGRCVLALVLVPPLQELGPIPEYRQLPQPYHVMEKANGCQFLTRGYEYWYRYPRLLGSAWVIRGVYTLIGDAQYVTNCMPIRKYRYSTDVRCWRFSLTLDPPPSPLCTVRYPVGGNNSQAGTKL